MILREATIKYKGYDPRNFIRGSSKRICCSCDQCGRVRWVTMQGYRDLCSSCSHKNQFKLPKPQFVEEKDRFISGTGIDRILTIEKFGYDPADLSEGSNRKVIVICQDCDKVRNINRRAYQNLCHKCSLNTDEYKNKVVNRHLSQETKNKIGEANSGKNNGMYGKIFTDEYKEKMSKRMKGENNPNYNKFMEEEQKIQISCTKQGITRDEWNGFATESPYCPKFNESCKESNRNKYDRECFICGKNEDENGKKLSVHHVDMNKNQGCDSNWKLVPLCISCHGKAHTKLWEYRLNYLLGVI